MNAGFMTTDDEEAIGTIPTPEDRVREIRVCDVVGCIEGPHEFIDGQKDELCCCISISEEAFLIEGIRDDATGLWAAYCPHPDFGKLEGPDGLVAAETFALAYRAVNQHCEQLNQLERSAP